MAFVATDKDGSEWIFAEEPHRDNYGSFWIRGYYIPKEKLAIELPTGSIRNLIGRELTWEDDPVELKGE